MDKRRSQSSNVVYGIAFVLALAVTGLGIWLALERGTWVMLAAGAASVLAVLVTWPIASQLCSFHSASKVMFTHDVCAKVNHVLIVECEVDTFCHLCLLEILKRFHNYPS